MRTKKLLYLLISASLVSSCQGGFVSSETPSSSSLNSSDSNEENREEIKETDLSDANIQDKYRNYYQIFVSSYADSNGDKVGDLKGIEEKVPYIKGLGFNGIWLTPIFKSDTYHKYNADDYFTIDPSFGTMEDLESLVAVAHQNGVKVILDLAVNHTGINNSWFQKAIYSRQKKIDGVTLTADEENFSSLYSFFDTKEQAEQSKKRYAQAPGHSFYYECNFSDNMPELDFDSDFAFAQVKSVTDFYLDKGIDGFRLDAVKYYAISNDSKNINILNKIYSNMTAKKEDVYVVGECWDNQAVLEKYYQSDVDSFFYFPASAAYPSSFYNVSALNPLFKKEYIRGLQSLLDTAGGKIPAPFLDNHDTSRMVFGGSKDATKFQYGLFALSNGNTFTYYGDELGMSSANNPGGDYSDSNYRTHYYWDDVTHAMETNDPPYAQPQKEYYPGSKQEEADPNSILNYVKKANSIRNALPGIARGTLETLEGSDKEINDDSSNPLAIVEKKYDGKEIKILINFSLSETVSYETSESYAFQAVLKGDESNKVYKEQGNLAIPPHTIVVLAN